MRRSLWLIAVLVLLATACGGPRRPVPVGVKDVATDVLLGGLQDEVAPRPIPLAPNPALPPTRSLRPQPAAPAPGPVPTPSPLCPKADPLSASPYEARNRVGNAPVAASYTYRSTGSISVDELTFPMPPIVERTIGEVSADEVPFTFELTENLLGTETTNVYSVTEDGIFITHQITEDGELEWTPPLTILPFPAQSGATWTVVSTALDGLVVMEYMGRIGRLTEDGDDDADTDPDLVDSRVRVDACGTFIDAWNVQLGAPDDPEGDPQGRLVTPDGTLIFYDTYAIPSAFGGFPLADTRVAEGVSSGRQIELDRNSIINTVPLEP